jgi:hypothetical protein
MIARKDYLTASRVDWGEIRRRFEAGETHSAIAKTLGGVVARTTILHRSRIEGWSIDKQDQSIWAKPANPHPDFVPTRFQAKIMHFFELGFSLAEISYRLQVDATLIEAEIALMQKHGAVGSRRLGAKGDSPYKDSGAAYDHINDDFTKRFKPRNCLKCGAAILSTGKHHRCCAKCFCENSDSDSAFDNDSEYVDSVHSLYSLRAAGFKKNGAS